MKASPQLRDRLRAKMNRKLYGAERDNMMLAAIGFSAALIFVALPWAINTATCIATGAIAYLYLPESLPAAQCVPFRWKGSNPLSFVTLFRRGAKLRIYSMVHICQYLLVGSGLGGGIGGWRLAK